MAKKPSKPRQRKLRADAQRNRERILDAAKEVFTRWGADAGLEDIARRAEVGAGTLYRHFPTRDALIETVYRGEAEKLAAAERTFTETMPPIDALRAWMLLAVDFIATKRLIAPALKGVVGDPSRLFESSRGLIQAANESLMKRAIGAGQIRGDLDPSDLLRALIGASHLATESDWEPSARRLVDILISGARPRPDLD